MAKLSDFMELSTQRIFYASEHNTITVLVKEDTPTNVLTSFPLPKQCNDCKARFRNSGVIEKIRSMQWEHTDSSNFNPHDVVSLLLYTCTVVFEHIYVTVHVKTSYKSAK